MSDRDNNITISLTIFRFRQYFNTIWGIAVKGIY